MATFKTIDEISDAFLDFLSLVRPDLDTKPGSVARDVFIDPPSIEISKLYNELRNISNLQSLASAVGVDLDKLAKNFGFVRGSGSPSNGTVWFTTNDLSSDVFIPLNSFVLSQGSQSFKTLVDAAFVASKSNLYSSNALRIRSELDLAGITDQYALEVAVEAAVFGSSGNIGKFGIVQTGVSGISNVTNITSLTGGVGTEDDVAFRSRVLGAFGGSNVGTTLGYINALLSDPRISGVSAVEPGDTLMTRDGTQIGTSDDGESIVISSGTGGKVDLYIQGSNLEPFSESFIYKDQSGRNDPTNESNDFILGQQDVNPFLDFQQKRKLLLESKTLPFQPVNSIASVTGSLSGPNFLQKYVDKNGNTQGNFELIKDEGSFGGSSFGFDKIKWLTSSISLPDESSAKGPFNGQDPLDFSDVKVINQSSQLVTVTNENSAVDRVDNSLLTVFHTPVSTVTRVDNLSTGERYSISQQNLDDGDVNLSGRIRISGSTLPSSSDILQVNYVWQAEFDSTIDFDDLVSQSEFRTVQDSIDWGYSNQVKNEVSSVLYSGVDGYHAISTLPISRVVNANRVTLETLTVTSGKIITSDKILSISSIKDSLSREAFFTNLSNGSFSNKEITLPDDTVILNGSDAVVRYNSVDVYSLDGYNEGSFNGSIISFDFGTVNLGEDLELNYVANIPSFLPTTSLTDLPATGSLNNYVVNSNVIGNQPIANEFDSNEDVVRNLKFAPSFLNMLVQGTSATGTIVVKGDTYTKIELLFKSTRDGLDLDLASEIKNYLGLSSFPNTMSIVGVDQVQKVTVADGSIANVDFSFDLQNLELLNTKYDNGKHIEDLTLSASEISISSTTSNLEQQPVVGEWLNIVCYVSNTNSGESIVVSASGNTYTKNKYAYVSSISIGSGFVGTSGSQDGTLSMTSFTQPTDGSTYSTSYSYTAPKEGERIAVNYNYNKVVNDSAFIIESVRPVTADVLTKEAKILELFVDLIVKPISNSNITEEALVANTAETISAFISDTGLDATIDASDIINTVYTVNGVDRVEITAFNTTGLGEKLRTVSSGRNSSFVAGNINVVIGS